MSTFLDSKYSFETISFNIQEATTMYSCIKEKFIKEKPENIKRLFEVIKGAIVENELLPKDYSEKYLDKFMYEIALELLYTAQNTTKILEKASGEKSVTTKSKIQKYLRANESLSAYSTLSPKISVNKKQMLNDYEEMNLKLSLKAIQFFKMMGFSNIKTKQKESEILLEPIDEIYVYDHYTQLVYNPNNEGILVRNLYNLILDFLGIHSGKREICVEQEVAAYIFEKIFFVIQYSKCFASYFDIYKKEISLSMNAMKLLIYVKMYDTSFMSFSEYLRQKYNVFSMDDDSKLLEEVYCISQLCLNFNLPILQLAIKEIVFEAYDDKVDELKKMLEKYIYNKCLIDSKGEFSYYKKMQVVLERLDKGCYSTGKHFVTSESLKTGSKEYIFNIIMSKMFYGKEDLGGWYYQYRNGNTFYEFVLRHYWGLDDYYHDKCIRELI